MNKYTIPAYFLPSEHFFGELRTVEVRYRPDQARNAKGMWCKEGVGGSANSSESVDKSSDKTYNYSSDEYSKMLKERTILSINNDVHSLPSEGKPNSIYDLTFTDNTVKQRRIIGGKGKASFDLDTTDHNQPWAHPNGAHKHYWENGKRRPDVLKFTDKEIYDNYDIIKKGVNYHDKK